MVLKLFDFCYSRTGGRVRTDWSVEYFKLYSKVTSYIILESNLT